MVRGLLVLALFANLERADALESLATAGAKCDAARAHCFGIRLHVAIGDAPVADAAWVARQLEFANRHFAALDVGWQIVGVEALPASALRIEDREERDSFTPQVRGTVVDVFVTGQLDDIDKPGGVVYGVTWWTKTWKFVILSTQAWERTLAHELGHVFGLPHSRFAISIMNKTPRTEPPPEERRFADAEIAAMKPVLAQLVRDKVLVDVARP